MITARELRASRNSFPHDAINACGKGISPLAKLIYSCDFSEEPMVTIELRETVPPIMLNSDRCRELHTSQPQQSNAPYQKNRLIAPSAISHLSGVTRGS